MSTNTFYYKPVNIDELNSLVEYFAKYQTPISNTELLNLYTLHRDWGTFNVLCVIANVTNGKASFSLEWSNYEGTELTKKQMRMIAHQDAYNGAYDEFSYKFELDKPCQEEMVIAAVESLGFELAKEEKTHNGRVFFNISIDNVYEGIRKSFAISSDEYLFWRNDSYIKTDYEHFTDILWIIELMGRKDNLVPINMRTGMFA